MNKRNAKVIVDVIISRIYCEQIKNYSSILEARGGLKMKVYILDYISVRAGFRGLLVLKD